MRKNIKKFWIPEQMRAFCSSFMLEERISLGLEPVAQGTLHVYSNRNNA